LFEITLSGGAMGSAARLAGRGGDAGAFFNGVLATALATPCTAPFLGLALGFAFSQPPLTVVLMLLTVGLGLAFPYVLISFIPGLARFLPRPGAWMEKFKVALGFPMAATAFWLLSILTRHYGTAAVLWIGVFLTLVAGAAWTWGAFVQRGGSRKRLAGGCAVALLCVAYFGVLEWQLEWRSPRGQERQTLQHSRGGISWEAWTPEGVAAARSAGRPVLVDFTADWCATCQANKKTSLEIPAVVDMIAETGAVAFLGDYTLRDDSITEELQRWGRAGVPLVLVYPNRTEEAPRVLPELLTPGIVLDALEWAGR
jgi:thiol:disulfide interchange protein DsbD